LTDRWITGNSNVLVNQSE